MKEIPLTQGKVAIVDDEDYEYLSQWKWFAEATKNEARWYAARNYGEHKGLLRMHRAIFLPNKVDLVIDHVDGNGLNNQRFNLRYCSFAENRRNNSLYSNSTSGYKGVSWHKRDRKWRANITVQSAQVSLGYFDSPEEAYKVYCEAAIKYFGEFARL